MIALFSVKRTQSRPRRLRLLASHRPLLCLPQGPHLTANRQSPYPAARFAQFIFCDVTFMPLGYQGDIASASMQ